jgi:hypothetical protein
MDLLSKNRALIHTWNLLYAPAGEPDKRVKHYILLFDNYCALP